MPNPKDETFTFRLSLKLKRSIKRCAKENNQSMAEWITTTLEAEIRTNWKTPAQIKKENELLHRLGIKTVSGTVRMDNSDQ